MALMIFTKGVDTFTFECGRVYPIQDPVEVGVVTDESEARKLYAYNKGVVVQYFILEFKNASKNDRDNVVDWLENTAVGPLNTFTFTDEDSNNHTVRMLDKKDPFREVDKDLFSGKVLLREEI